MRNWLSVIICFVFVIGFSQNLWAQSTEYAFKGDLKAFSVNGAADNTYVWKLTPPGSSVQVLSVTGNSSGNIAFTIPGTYLLAVQATDIKGCLSEPLIKNIVVRSEVTVTANVPYSGENAGSNGRFTVDLGAVNNTGTSITVSYAVSGNAAPGDDYPIIPLFAVIPNGSQTAAIEVNGIDDDLVEDDETVILTLTGSDQVLFPVTSNPALKMATIKIVDNDYPVIPTVNSLITNDATPVLTGTATVGANEVLKVTVNGITYSTGDGNLRHLGLNWSLQIPATNSLADNTWSVEASVVSLSGLSSTDRTSNELVVDTSAPVTPTVFAQVTGDTTPTISGTATVGTGEILKVELNGVIYSQGDGKLFLSGNNWSLQIPSGNEIPDGIYSVTASVIDAAGNSSTDTSTGELTINTKGVAGSDRQATNDMNLTFRNTPVSGNVLTNDAGFWGFNPTVGMYLEPVNGKVIMNNSGQYTYTPKTDFTGTDNFYYTVCTVLNPADCDTVNVTIHVVPDVLSQIQPIANDDEIQTMQNTQVRGNVLANDLSVSGEKLIMNLKQKDGPKSGVVALNADGSFVYTPKTGFVGVDYFVYEICGSVSGLCAQARVSITVSGDPEVLLFAADDAFFSYGKTIQGNLLINDVYSSAGALSVNRTPKVQALHGNVAINSNGTFSYTPSSGFVGTDQFVYEICDSNLKDCDQATVFIFVKETPAQYADLAVKKTGPSGIVPGETVNYEISVTNQGTATASKIQISDYLPSAIQNPVYNISGSKSAGNWAGYYELNELEVNKSFNLFISGTVASNASDTLKNVATVTSLTWDPNPDNNISVVKTKVLRNSPVARIAGLPYLAVGSCNTQGVVLDASQSSGDGLQFSWLPASYLDNPLGAKAVFRPGKTTRYKLTVTDIRGQKDTASVLVVVANAPKAVTDKNVFVDAPNKTILLNGSQSTGAGLSYLWQSKEGIILNGETTPTAQVSGLGMYYLQVTDSLGCFHKDSVNVGLYIQAINDTAQTKINESVVINVLKNDSPKGSINPASISIVTPPLHGIASVDADSLILYMPVESYIGQDEFVYQVCDYFKKCDQAKVLVLINDIPLFIPEAFSPNGDGINDKFEIKGLSKYKTVEIEIFNRWGNVVYRSSNYGNGNGKAGFWDGTAQTGVRIGSGPVSTGTYFYILKLNGKENINGSIYLDR